MATIKYKIGLSNADKQQMASDVLDEVINGEIVVGEETTNITEKVSEINGAVNTVNNKANKDGSYELMTVGLSKQLQASLGVTTTDGFTERTTAGDASVSDGVAEIKSIKGVSIRNLVANSDLLIDSNSDSVPDGFRYSVNTIDITLTNGIAKFTPTAKYSYFVKSNNSGAIIGNKYYIFAFVKSANNSTSLSDSTGSFVCHSGSAMFEYLSLVSTKTTTDDRIEIMTALSADWTPIEVDYIGAINLTDLGWEALDKDQVYNLITNNGTNPENFRKLAMGETIYHLNLTGIKTVGFNQFDGVNARVLGGHKYNVSGTYTSLEFAKTVDGSKEAIVLTENGGKYSFIPAENGYAFVNGSGADTVINLSWSGYRDSDYEDYWTETRPLDTTVYFPTGMKRVRGAYDELFPNKAIQRIASVDLGSLNWTYHASSGGTDTARFIATASQLPFAIKNVAVDVKPNILCTKYNTVTSDQSLDTTFGNLNIAQYLATDLVVVNTSYTSASTFKTAMNGVILYYEVATPIETTITPALNLTYHISDFGTEEWIQPSSSFVPFIDAEIFYQENLRDKIQRLADIQKPSTETDGIFIPEVSVVSGAPTISWQPKAVKELPTLPVTPISTVFVLKCTVDENGAPTLSWEAESV